MKTEIQIIQHLLVADQLIYAHTSQCSYIVTQIIQQSIIDYTRLIEVFFPTLKVQQVCDIQTKTGLLLTGWPVHSMFTRESEESMKTLDLCVQYTH